MAIIHDLESSGGQKRQLPVGTCIMILGTGQHHPAEVSAGWTERGHRAGQPPAGKAGRLPAALQGRTPSLPLGSRGLPASGSTERRSGQPGGLRPRLHFPGNVTVRRTIHATGQAGLRNLQ